MFVWHCEHSHSPSSPYSHLLHFPSVIGQSSYHPHGPAPTPHAPHPAPRTPPAGLGFPVLRNLERRGGGCVCHLLCLLHGRHFSKQHPWMTEGTPSTGSEGTQRALTFTFTECPPCARLYAKHTVRMNSLNPHNDAVKRFRLCSHFIYEA